MRSMCIVGSFSGSRYLITAVVVFAKDVIFPSVDWYWLANQLKIYGNYAKFFESE